MIEDYHPLDVECAAATLALLREIRRVRPEIGAALDGDGGDEGVEELPARGLGPHDLERAAEPAAVPRGLGRRCAEAQPDVLGRLVPFLRAHLRAGAGGGGLRGVLAVHDTRGCIAASSRAGAFEELGGGGPGCLLLALKGAA